jgi:hypothetical protein
MSPAPSSTPSRGLDPVFTELEDGIICSPWRYGPMLRHDVIACLTYAREGLSSEKVFPSAA